MQTGQGHNREKHYFFQDGEYEPFLYHLGISDKTGRVYDKNAAKFRQINVFTDYRRHLSGTAPKRHIICLRSLLRKKLSTFAAYRYLTKAHNRTVDICGMDRKEDVIALCRDTAQALGYDGMHFICGDINDYHPPHAPHLVLSLHACDIATDVVLYHAQRLGAGVILSTPAVSMNWQRNCAQMSPKKSCKPIKRANRIRSNKNSRCSRPTNNRRHISSRIRDKTRNTPHNLVLSYTANNLLFPILHHDLLTEKFAAVCTMHCGQHGWKRWDMKSLPWN